MPLFRFTGGSDSGDSGSMEEADMTVLSDPVLEETMLVPFLGHFDASDRNLRMAFDHQLGEYLHERRIAGWDIAAITDTLDFVGDHAGSAWLDLIPEHDGTLRVCITFDLPEHPTAGGETH